MRVEALFLQTNKCEGVTASNGKNVDNVVVVVVVVMVQDNTVDSLFALEGDGQVRGFDGTYSEYLEVDALPSTVCPLCFSTNSLMA
eukprot:3436490-Pyramimonas_sp.AAC.1